MMDNEEDLTEEELVLDNDDENVDRDDIEDDPKEGSIYLKSRLLICATCCRGPAQEELPPNFTLDEDKLLSSCSACQSAYFCSKGT